MAKILVVDDDIFVRQVLKLMLKKAGHQVSEAGDGEEGLSLARRERPDLTLLDVMLPKLDGYRLCKMLKFDQRYQDLKVVFFTAKASPEAVDLAKAAGGDAYITKDTDSAKIVELINGMIGTPSQQGLGDSARAGGSEGGQTWLKS